jgi:hypothetical protein
MPRVSFFYGITIYMYFDENPHLGRPHFHAVYGDDEASLSIEDGSVLAGSLPGRALQLVNEWEAVRRGELLTNWERARRGEALRRIAPLR